MVSRDMVEYIHAEGLAYDDSRAEMCIIRRSIIIKFRMKYHASFAQSSTSQLIIITRSNSSFQFYIFLIFPYSSITIVLKKATPINLNPIMLKVERMVRIQYIYQNIC